MKACIGVKSRDPAVAIEEGVNPHEPVMGGRFCTEGRYSVVGVA